MTTSRRITKKEIKQTLRTLDATKIFRIAKLSGVNIEKRIELLRFIQENAPSQKVYKKAYSLSFGAGNNKHLNHDHSLLKMPVTDVIKYAKKQKTQGFSNYSKILVIGNSSIYWASPVYMHGDYNKSIALKNNSKNRDLADKINKYLDF